MTVDLRGRDEAGPSGPVYHPPTPTTTTSSPSHPLPSPPLCSPGPDSGSKSTPNQSYEPGVVVVVVSRGGRERAVSSPLFISAGDVRTGSVPVF